MAEPSVAALLPLRMETLFDRPKPAGPWRLRVLFVPDEPSVDRLDERPRKAELDAVASAWQTYAPLDVALTAEQARDLMRRLADRLGAPRAQWLFRRYLPAAGNRDFALATAFGTDRKAIKTDRPERRVSRLFGLPPRIALYALWKGSADPELIGTTALKPALLHRDQLGDPSETDEKKPGWTHADAWWSSWPQAEKTGLGKRFDLDRHPKDIKALIAVGLATADPRAHFERHLQAGRLAIVEPGTPTNTVHGAPAASLGRDPDEWFAALTGDSRPAEWPLQALIPGIGELSNIPGGESASIGLGSLLVQALWPALFGHVLKDVWGLPQPQVDAAGNWAQQNLFPEGPLPPIRIGDQPYGLLPATSLARWRRHPGDPEIEEELRPTLLRIVDTLACMATRAGTVEGANSERLLDLIGRTPLGETYVYRTLLPLDYIGPALGRPMPPGVEDRWDSVAAEAITMMNGRRPARRYVGPRPAQPLYLPLVEPDEGSLVETIERVRKVTFGPEMPRFKTVLARLLNLSRMLAYAEAHRAKTGVVSTPMLDEVAFVDEQSQLLADARGWTPHLPQLRGIYGGVDYVWIDQALADLLDLFEPGSTRPTAWVERVFRATLDCASHRVDPWVTGLALRRAHELRVRPQGLGLYGWVDRPWTGTRDERIHAVVHAPSDAQARTAVILRDKALFDPEATRWQIDLDSQSVRLASRIAEEVRLGAHLAEVLGREVERAVGDAGAIKRLRDNFTLRTEHAGRRTCDGLKVLGATADELAVAKLAPAKKKALAPLRKALNAYGDLLVADAVHAVVQGRGEAAGATMDAAAGFALPPVLDVVRTPRPGRTATTTVLLALPPGPRGGAAAEVAEPAFAKFLRDRTGDPGTPAWTWRLGAKRVSLADVGLSPIHALASTAVDLRRLLEKAPGRPGAGAANGPATLERARRIAQQLACEPPPGGREELEGRLTTLRQAARDLHAALLGPAGAARARALRNAARWGVIPPDASDDAAAAAAADELKQRLDATKVVDDPDDKPDAPRLEPGALDLARALRALTCPGTPLPILARQRVSALPGAAALKPEPARGAAAGALDRDWLAVVAAVRPALARLEAFQLEAQRPLRAHATDLANPWGANLDKPRHDLVVVYAPDALSTGAAAEVAVGAIDAFGETIPAADQVTTGAFHLDGPSARAPQAILIAVAPDVDKPLDEETLAAIVAETRLLARARMVRPEDLAPWAAAVPLTAFPAVEPGGARLDA